MPKRGVKSEGGVVVQTDRADFVNIRTTDGDFVNQS